MAVEWYARNFKRRRKAKTIKKEKNGKRETNIIKRVHDQEWGMAGTWQTAGTGVVHEWQVRIDESLKNVV